MFPYILTYYFSNKFDDIVYVSTTESNLSDKGGIRTKGYSELFNVDTNLENHLIVAGGESLCVRWFVILSYLVPWVRLLYRLSWKVSKLSICKNFPDYCVSFVDFVFNEDELEENLQKLIEKNSLKEGFLYFKVSKGVSSKDFDLVEWFEPIIMAYVYEYKIENNPLVKSGVTIILLPEIQWKKIYKKSGSFAARCYAQKMITKAKAYDGFFVENDYIAYSLNSSVFIIKDKNLIAKPLPNDKILSFASELGLEVDERAFSMQDVYNADEVFISAASLPILPVVKVDERLINFGEVGEFSKKLMQRYIQNMQDEARKSKYFAL